MMHDLRFALRMINSHRWFSAAVVATIAFGIGLNTMVFTLVNAVMFKPLSIQGGEYLVVMLQQNPQVKNTITGICYADFRQYRSQSKSFDALEAGTGDQGVISEEANPPQVFNLERVSSGLFEMMHTPPILGRGFSAADDKPGAEAVVMLGYGVWKDRYGASPKVLGRVVRVNGLPATIVGVMPEGFKFPQNSDFWMPIVPGADTEKRTNRNLELYGMLRPGVTREQANAELGNASRQLAATFPDTNKDLRAYVQTFHERFNGEQIRLVFLLMQAAVGFVLLIACANVANMMFSRALERKRELSIRAAMGATRWQIVRQLLIESVLLSSFGGLLGFALASYGVHGFDLATRDVGKPYWIEFTMNYQVFGVFAALCIFSGLIFGLAPALRASRVDLNSALKDGTRTAGTHRGGRLTGVLVAFQFAMTLVLLTGAAMFVRGIFQARNLNPTVPSDHLLGARVRLPKDHYPDLDARQRFYDQLMPRLQAIPGVMRVSYSANTPGLGSGTRNIEIEDHPLTDIAHAPSATYMVESPGYFSTIDLPFLSGRDFEPLDGGVGRRSAIVSKEFNERHWPHQSAIGKRFRIVSTDSKDKPGEWMSVIGVVANMVQRPNESSVEPLVFVPFRQQAYESMVLLVRASGPANTTSAVRSAVQSIDPDLPLFDVRTVSESIERQVWMLRVFGTLFGIFAIIALVIASVGMYAVIAQATARRTQEIGVRMALGARPRHIVTMVLSRGIIQLLGGLVLGLAASFPVASMMGGLPMRVSTKDPVVFASVSAVLMIVGLFACWLPARRASRLEPVAALRDE